MPKLVSTNKIMNPIYIYWLMDLGFYMHCVTAEDIFLLVGCLVVQKQLLVAKRMLQNFPHSHIIIKQFTLGLLCHK